MAKAVFTTKPSPSYDDLPEFRYHFPRTYLRQAQDAVGDWIVYYEPRRLSSEASSRGGRQAYFATARFDRIEADTQREDHFYAFLTDYLEFDRPVPFQLGGTYFEQGLRKGDGSTNKRALGRAGGAGSRRRRYRCERCGHRRRSPCGLGVTSRSVEPVVLFTTLGPNPAPLLELLWALAHHHQRLVVEAHVVVTERGARYLAGEILVPGGPLDQLVALLGTDLAHGPTLRVHLARLADGAPVVDDEEPAHAEAYRQAVWSAALEACHTAGPRPLIFALAAGRRRTMVALQTMAYQMLARQQDVCLDVRVSDRRAEGGSGFYFPEQEARWLEGPRGPFDARAVGVQLVPVQLTRLRGVLAAGDMHTPSQALQASQAAIDRAQPPALRIDLTDATCVAGEQPVPLSPVRLLWYAALALERRSGGEGWLHPGAPSVVALVKRCRLRPWFQAKGMLECFRQIASGETVAKLAQDEGYRVLRAKVRVALRDFCQAMPQHAPLLVPQTGSRPDAAGKRVPVQRLALAPGFIEVRGPEAVTLPRLSRPDGGSHVGNVLEPRSPIMTTRRTSLSDPLYIDWIAGIVSGRVGITIAPGKQSTSFYMPGSVWRRDLGTDLDTLVSLGATDLVTLLEDRDITRLAIPGLLDQARARGLRTHHLPIVDGSVPEHEAPLLDLLEALRQRLEAGASVVIHCEGGKGRSGVVAGCLLLSLGATLPQTLQHLRQARGPSCPENPRQLAYLERFAARSR